MLTLVKDKRIALLNPLHIKNRAQRMAVLFYRSNIKEGENFKERMDE